MTNVILHHPTGHPYWQKNQFCIEFPQGIFMDVPFHLTSNGTLSQEYIGAYKYGFVYEIYVENDGIYAVGFWCSSGGGKRPVTAKTLLLARSEYNEVRYMGTPLVISESLQSEMREYQHN